LPLHRNTRNCGFLSGVEELARRRAVDDHRQMAVSLEIICARLRRVPEGFVTTYGDLSPGAPRQAGRALSVSTDANLPWWRVVHSDGTWVKGERQRRLLEAEGIPIDGARVVMSEARIPPEAIL
jgi:alkylated DNA nucleotide flippase Atl1